MPYFSMFLSFVHKSYTNGLYPVFYIFWGPIAPNGRKDILYHGFF